MKRNFLLLLFLTFISGANAQWVQLNSGTTEDLSVVYCLSPETCFVGGWNGTMLKTIDGGVGWNLSNNGLPSGTFTTIFCITNNTCLTNEAYKTIDGGNTWLLKSTPMSGYSSIEFLNDSIGYATGPGGGQMVRTTDVGETWSWVSTLYSGILNDVFFTDVNTGYAVGGDCVSTWVVLKTSDGGNTWPQIYSDTGWCFKDVLFVNDSTGFVTGFNGTILKTIDSGNNWNSLNTGTAGQINAIDCINEDTCYAVGTDYTIIKTTDGGTTWTFDTTGIPNTGNIAFSDISCPSSQVCYTIAGSLIFKKDLSIGMNPSYISKLQVSIYPNPFSEKTTIYLTGKTNNKNLDFELYDFTGRKIKELQLNNSITKLERNGLVNGMYLYRLTNDGELLAAGKLMVN